MKLQEFQKPLVQSALVLLAIFLLIGFVAGSETQTILGGITAIFKGIIYTILLVIALAISIVVSIALLTAIFLGAVAIYSPQTSADIYQKLRHSLSSLWSGVSPLIHRTGARAPEGLQEDSRVSARQSKTSASPIEKPTISAETVQRVNDTRQELSAEIQTLDKKVQELRKENTEISTAVNELESKVSELPVEEVSATTEMLSSKQEELSASLTECLSRLESIDDTVKKNSSTVQEQSAQLKEAGETIAKLSATVESLQDKLQQAEKTEASKAEPEDEPRIFAYLENEKDKKKFADLIDQAVEKNMTYAEIDDYLTENLSKKVDTIIKEHPALTKEFIRDKKNA